MDSFSRGSHDSRRLWIGGLEWDTTERHLRDYFSFFGEVVKVNLMKDKRTGMSRGFAFIIFQDVSSIDKIMDFKSKIYLNGKKISCERARPKNQLDSTLQETDECFSKVFVGGLNPTSTDLALYTHFSKYARVEDCIVVRTRSGNRSRGFGFVMLSHPEDAVYIMREPEHVVDGVVVECKRAVPNRYRTSELEAKMPSNRKHVDMPHMYDDELCQIQQRSKEVTSNMFLNVPQPGMFSISPTLSSRSPSLYSTNGSRNVSPDVDFTLDNGLVEELSHLSLSEDSGAESYSVHSATPAGVQKSRSLVPTVAPVQSQVKPDREFSPFKGSSLVDLSSLPHLVSTPGGLYRKSRTPKIPHFSLDSHDLYRPQPSQRHTDFSRSKTSAMDRLRLDPADVTWRRDGSLPSPRHGPIISHYPKFLDFPTYPRYKGDETRTSLAGGDSLLYTAEPDLQARWKRSSYYNPVHEYEDVVAPGEATPGAYPPRR